MKDLNLNINQVLEILLRALDHIDVRLVDHGHRVAYIVYKMMQAEGVYQEKEMQEICIVASLHDIGAYKTEEIDHMMRFESEDVFDHSVYGYLFLKHMSPLRKLAEIVLFHHLNYEKYYLLDYEYKNIADMIHLADRMDVMLQLNERWLNDVEITAQQDIRYGRETINLFRKANEKYDIEENIMNGSYLEDLNSFIKTAEYGDDTLLEFIKMIAYSIDFRSETTVSHVIATVSIGVELGKIFKLNEIEMKKIQLGAYLHDIGKISTPLEILEKPGGLTHDEMLIMRQHINKTGNILKGRIHHDVVQIACRHHEKSDGSGYPEGLMENKMTLSDKIVAVADIMSALTGERSYKESFPKDKVVNILQSQKLNGKLSGKVIDAAISHYDDIMECCQKNVSEITEMYNRISKEFRFTKVRFEEMG